MFLTKRGKDKGEEVQRLHTLEYGAIRNII